jgi:hypothetical protein
VLAHQALVELGLSCDLFVTFGSPLWIADKYPQLWYPVSKPAGVLRWVNFYSPIDWLVGRRPIAAADLNIRTWNTHRALQYLRSPVLRAALPPVFEAVFDDDTPPAAPAIAA